MKDWLTKADQFIEFNDYELLTDHERITRAQANEIAAQHYDLFNQGRRKSANEQAERELVEQLREADRRLVAQRKRLTPRTKGQSSVD